MGRDGLTDGEIAMDQDLRSEVTPHDGRCCGGGANPGGHEWNCAVLRGWSMSQLTHSQGGRVQPDTPLLARLNATHLAPITDEQRAVLMGDRGTGALDDGEPQTVVLSGREYERYLDGALNEQVVHAGGDDMDDLVPTVLAIRHLLDAVAPDRDDHTIDTPLRAAKMWRDLLRGQEDDPTRYLEKTFSAPRDGGLIIQSGIEMTSVCAHHLLPFTGKATVAYRPSPGQDVVGLSKLTRVLQAFAARLQIQERIGAQVVEAIQDKLLPSGVMVVITAKHDCMRLRGVRDDGSETTTVAAAGMLTAQEVSFIQAAHLQKLN